MKTGVGVLAFLGASLIGVQANALPAYDESQPRTAAFQGHGEARYRGTVSGSCYECGEDGSTTYFTSDVAMEFVFDVDIMWDPDLYGGIFYPDYYIKTIITDVDGRIISAKLDEDGWGLLILDSYHDVYVGVDDYTGGCGVFWKSCAENDVAATQDDYYFAWLEDVSGRLFDYESGFSSITPFLSLFSSGLTYQAGLPVSRNPEATNDGDFEGWLSASGTLYRSGGWIAAVPLPDAGALFGPTLLGMLGAFGLRKKLKAKAA